MASETTLGVNTTTGWGTWSQGVVNRIEAQAYKMLYDTGLMPSLLKTIGQGQKGSAIIFPYFDPSAMAITASNLTEASDLTVNQTLVNASVIIVASELGIRSFITDTLRESNKVSIEDELARQQGIAVALRLDKHCLARINAGVSKNAAAASIAGTNAVRPFTFAKYAAAKVRLDGRALTVPGRKRALIPVNSWYWTTRGALAGTATQTSNSVAFNVNGPVGERVLSNYYLTTLFGDIDLYTMGIALTSASSAAYGYMFVDDAIGLWKPRDFRLERQRDASFRGDELISTMRAGCQVLLATYCVRLKMMATDPS